MDVRCIGGRGFLRFHCVHLPTCRKAQPPIFSEKTRPSTQVGYPQTLENKGNSHDADHIQDHGRGVPHDLQAAWPTLSPAIRAMIEALARQS